MMPKNLCLLSRVLLFFVILLCLAFPAPAANRTLALFPLAIYAERPADYLRRGLTTMFLSRLSGGGLDVITDETFGALLTDDEKSGKITKKRVEEIAGKLKAHYGVFGSVTSMGGGASLDLSLLDLTKAPPKLTHVSEAMAEDQFIPKVADAANRFRAVIEGRYAGTRRMVGAEEPVGAQGPAGGIFSRLGQPEAGSGEGSFFRPTIQYGAFQPTGTVPLHLAVLSFASADLTGDGNLEILVLGLTELRVYTKKGEGYRLSDTYEASTGEVFLKVSAGDVDGNGRPEIYLVSFYGQVARSTALEWNGKFKKRLQKKGHLLVAKDAGDARPRLLYEGTQNNRLFAGAISLMGYDATGKLQEIRSLPEIKGARFYSLTPYDLNKDGTPEFIGLGEGDSLHVWGSDGAVLWKEDERIGGTNNAIQVGEVMGDDSKPWVSINSRLAVIDIDGDGKKELIAVKNSPQIGFLTDMLVYVKSQLVAYRIDGATLTRGWTTRQIPYCVTDMEAAGGTLFLAAQKGRLSKIGKGEGRIMWFNFQ